MEEQPNNNEVSPQAKREDVDQALTKSEQAPSPPSQVPAIRAKGRPRKVVSEADQARALKQRLAYLDQFEVADLATLAAEPNGKPLESLLIDQSYAAQKTAARLLNFADGALDPKEMNMGYKHAAIFMKLSIDAALAANKIRRAGRQKVTVQHVNVNKGGQAVIAGNVNKDKESSDPQS
jgi:hypothetical protein